jgi:hypothetical protein
LPKIKPETRTRKQSNKGKINRVSAHSYKGQKMGIEAEAEVEMKIEVKITGPVCWRAQVWARA